MLTRAAVACLIEPNARKAYPLALIQVRPAAIRGSHLRIGHRHLMHTRKGVVAGPDERNRSDRDYRARDGSSSRLGALPRSFAQEERAAGVSRVARRALVAARRSGSLQKGRLI